MAVNQAFTTSGKLASASEQNLYADLIKEAIQIHGHDVNYVDRTLTARDDIFGEDSLSTFSKQQTIEMYVEDADGGYQGEKELIQQFGLENRNEITFVVSRTRFDDVAHQMDLETATASTQGSILLESGTITSSLTNKISASFGTAYLRGEAASTSLYANRPKEGDLILLHGCCHNPTGANLKAPEWDAVIELLLKSGATPMIDIAYQGFGDGLEEDAAGVRKLVNSVPETILAASCSKNFGIYRERTGLLIVVSHDKDARDLNQSTLAFLNRQNFSFPPDHGARLVTMVLSDEELKISWMEELEAVRTSMLSLRTQLATELEKLSGSWVVRVR